ncbi:MAG: hypothetical protein ACHQ49_13950, partial [Elusimicrobiota bacterium]
VCWAVSLVFFGVPLLRGGPGARRAPAAVIEAPQGAVFSAPAIPALVFRGAAPADLLSPFSAPAVSAVLLPPPDLPAPSAAAPLAVDASERFLALHADVRVDLAGPLPTAASTYRYSFVRGFMGNHITGYMTENVERLKALGLDADVIPIATEGDSNGALAAIGRAVAASPKPVVLIGHSRGGMLVHDWYRGAPDDLKARAAGLILMQATIGGSPVADAMTAHWAARLLARLLSLLPSWGGVLETLEELTVSARGKVLAALPPLTAADLRKILVLQSSFDPATGGAYHRDMFRPWKIFEGRETGATDGLAGAAESGVPGARTIHLEDVDHEDTVIENAGWIKWLLGSRPNPKYRVGDISEALVRFFFLPSAG